MAGVASGSVQLPWLVRTPSPRSHSHSYLNPKGITFDRRVHGEAICLPEWQRTSTSSRDFKFKERVAESERDSAWRVLCSNVRFE